MTAPAFLTAARRCTRCGSPLFSGELDECMDCELDRDFPDLALGMGRSARPALPFPTLTPTQRNR